MARSIRSFSGADKDAYLDRVADAGEAGGDAGRIANRLKAEVTRVWVRLEALDGGAPRAACVPDAEADGGEAVMGDAAGSEAAPDDTFSPFEPNVIVVLRTAGRERLLEALRAIAAPHQLRLLAREQQLGVDQDIEGAEELRLAIITAAERRVANRRAAAS